MAEVNSERHRDFALEVVRRLRRAGFMAFWAGGCVRDMLLNRVPNDYDVATNALPAQVREVFGHRRSVMVGAAFGVVAVVGPRGSGQIEVTTFRSDACYSDGRHPDAVIFTTPQEDAARRDFTINGLFLDPLEESVGRNVIDYVGGQADLEAGIVRAIGEPRERFAEDRLRLLRAVRFAAALQFRLDPATRRAVCELAPSIVDVSRERIAQEMRAMLEHPHRRAAIELLFEVGLLEGVLPELVPLAKAGMDLDSTLGDKSAWHHTLDVLDQVSEPAFPLALAALLHQVPVGGDSASPGGPLPEDASEIAFAICRRWKLSNKTTNRVVWLVQNQRSLVDAPSMPMSRLHPFLIAEGVGDLVALHEAIARAKGCRTDHVEFVRKLLELPPELLNPPPLLNGDDLIRHGVAVPRRYGQILSHVRNAQLDGLIRTKDEALQRVDLWLQEQGDREM